jgi:hypothetical protein
VRGWKAPKNICQQASPGFPRLRSGQALRLRAIGRPLCDGSARRFAQDDAFWGLKNISRRGPRNRRSLGYAPPDFLWALVALSHFMRLSLAERRTHGLVQRSVAGNPGRDDKGDGHASMEGGCLLGAEVGGLVDELDSDDQEP